MSGTNKTLDFSTQILMEKLKFSFFCNDIWRNNGNMAFSCTEMNSINNTFGCLCTEMLGNYDPLFEIRMHIFWVYSTLGYSQHS